MQDSVGESLQKIRAIIEAAERGIVIDEPDLLHGKQVIHDLLNEDCVMPATISEVSRSWKSIECSVAPLIRYGAAKLDSEVEVALLEHARAAYQDIEAALLRGR